MFKVGFFQSLLIPIEILSLVLFAFIASVAVSISTNDTKGLERAIERLRGFTDALRNLGTESQVLVVFAFALFFLTKSFLSAVLLNKTFDILGREHENIIKLKMPKFFIHQNQRLRLMSEFPMT